MEKLFDKYYEKAKHEAIKLKREAKKIAELETPLEKNIREATENTNWGCANSVLQELADACTSFEDRQKIMQKIWEKLQGDEDKWRRLVKTLTLLEYLLKNGPEQIVGEAQSEQLLVRRLTTARCMEDGQERGSSVREKAKSIMEMIGDRELLKSERTKAKEYRQKMGGVSSSGYSGGLSSGGGGYSGGGYGGSSGGGGGGGGSRSGGSAMDGAMASISKMATAAAAEAGFDTQTNISRSAFEDKFAELKRRQAQESQQKSGPSGGAGRDSDTRRKDDYDDRRRDDDRRDRRRDDDDDDDRDRRDRRDRRRDDSDDDRKGYDRFDPDGGDDRRDRRRGGDDREEERAAPAAPAMDLLDFGGDAPAPAAAPAAADFGDFNPVGGGGGGFPAMPPPGGGGFPAMPPPGGGISPAGAANVTDFLGAPTAAPAPAAPSGGGDLFDTDFQSGPSSGFNPLAAAPAFPAAAPAAPVFGGMPGAQPAPAAPAPDMFGGFNPVAAPAPAPAMGGFGAPAPAMGAPAPAMGGFGGSPMQAGFSPPAAQQPMGFGGAGMMGGAPAPAMGAPAPAAAAAPMPIPANVLPDGVANMLGDLTLTSSGPPPGPPSGQPQEAPKQPAGQLDIGNPFELG